MKQLKQRGSVASIFLHGIEWDIPITHPSFYAIYEEAERQDLPVTVHTGNGSSPTISRMFEGMPRPGPRTFPFVHPLGKGLVSGPYVRYGFTQILESDLLEVFPKLRVAFLEAGCEWAPFIVSGLQRKAQAKEWLGERVFGRFLPTIRSACTVSKTTDSHPL